MKKFNTTGVCVPEEDYMVDLGGKLEQIKGLVANRSYFSINRGRQYGKTTVLTCLEKELAKDYTVAFISFEGVGDQGFSSEGAFCQMFLGLVAWALQFSKEPIEYIQAWENFQVDDFGKLKAHLTKMCRGKKVILMIDEVDKISNSRIFLHFLGILRDKFLLRKVNKDFTFHSVILSGVYDIRNIKLKLVNEGMHPLADKLQNSPWNIAVNFNVAMWFSSEEIVTMLREYEADHRLGILLKPVADLLFEYTGGYPFLVSRVCQCVDDELGKEWSLEGIHLAVKRVLQETNTLFDDIYKNLEASTSLYQLVYGMLMDGKSFTFNEGVPEIALGVRYGFLKAEGGQVAVANRMFETLMTNYFISKNEVGNIVPKLQGMRSEIIPNGRFKMKECLEQFSEKYAELYKSRNTRFLEEHGKMLFLMYLMPLINGVGRYYIEPETLSQERMDVVVNYAGEELIIELKIWKGKVAHEAAYRQLKGYLDARKESSGYLLTFDFRECKEPQSGWVEFDGKKIFDCRI
ncbi:MAG: AAA-like domain-containing protein [Turicibacter sp.]|nr:AAA-like domain-containing protein [Turicibacter sp.]